VSFGWPLAVRVSNGRAFIADLVNRRVVVVRLSDSNETVAEWKWANPVESSIIPGSIDLSHLSSCQGGTSRVQSL